MNKSMEISYVQKYFDKAFASYPLTTKEKQRLAEIIQLIPDSAKTILDAGSGDCRLSNLIQSQGRYTVTSLDLSMRGLKDAKSRVINGMINSLPFPGNCFDLVICNEVLEHLPDNIYYNSVHELLRVTNKFILVSVPNNENILHNQLKCNHCGEVVHTWGHIRKFNKGSFNYLMKHVSKIDIFEFGPAKAERSLNWLYIIGRKYGKYYDLPNSSICINCGNAISKRNNSKLLGYISFRLIWRINKYFPSKINEKTWIAFLIKK